MVKLDFPVTDPSQARPKVFSTQTQIRSVRGDMVGLYAHFDPFLPPTPFPSLESRFCCTPWHPTHLPTWRLLPWAMHAGVAHADAASDDVALDDVAPAAAAGSGGLAGVQRLPRVRFRFCALEARALTPIRFFPAV